LRNDTPLDFSVGLQTAPIPSARRPGQPFPTA
jgi:hypothetical protein